MKRVGWPGKGYKFTCHRCGFWFASTRIRKEWTGIYVCQNCFETRHPQTFIKVHGEKAFPDIVSKDGTDTFVSGSICTIETSSGFAGLGTAGCMQAGNNTIPFDVLNGLSGNGH